MFRNTILGALALALLAGPALAGELDRSPIRPFERRARLRARDPRDHHGAHQGGRRRAAGRDVALA